MLNLSKLLPSKVKFLNTNFIYKFIFAFLILFPSIPIYSYGETTNLKLDKSYLDKKIDQPYILGTGDLITIEINDSLPDSKKPYRIDGEGLINIKGLGDLYISGLTVSELEKILKEKFNEIMFESYIKIDVIEHRSVRLNIQGEVFSPGLVTLKGQEYSEFKPKTIQNKTTYNDFPTLYDAIKGAGGITLSSDLQNIEIIRKNSLSNGGGLIKANINFLDFLNGQVANNNIRVFDGDTITVNKLNKQDKSLIIKAMRQSLNPKLIEVFIYGKIQKEGLIKLSNVATLNDAIEFAGGQLPLSGKITLGRIEGDGSVVKRTIKYKKSSKKGTKSNPYLMQGDIISVGSSRFNKVSGIINEVTSPLSGLINAYLLFNIFDD